MRLISVGIGLGLCVVSGCGLRSDPLFIADTDVGSSATDTMDTDESGDASESSGEPGDFPPPVEGRAGSCTNPIELPTTDSSASGELRGPGLYTTECGAAEGLEDVYSFTPVGATDVTLTFDSAQNDFAPIVRVTENACGEEATVLRQCTDQWTVDNKRHFLAFGNRTYYIAVDSSGGGGNYAFDVSLEPVPLQECDIHPETITQNLGSRFLWENEFPGGQGTADSQCGGVGRENVFPMEIFSPGTVSITATGLGAYRPLISVRTNCSALTESECISDQLLGTPGFAFLSVFLEPGSYFLSIDSLTLDEGGYALEVDFG